MLNDKPIKIALELVKIYGASLLEDPERLGQLLEDKCGECRHEIFVLSFALRDIIKGGVLPDALEFERNRERVMSRFRDNLGFSQVSALWAADAISAILSDVHGRPGQGGKIEARRGFLSDLGGVYDRMAKRPRTAPIRKKAFRNGFLLLGIIALFLGLFVRITNSRVTVLGEHKLLFLAHLSGADAALGHVRLKGAQLAADQINGQGGVKGIMLRIVARDIPRNPVEAAAAVEEILKDRSIEAIISACGDTVNKALAEVADRNELPLVSTESGLMGVTMATPERPWLYSFRTANDNSYKGRVLAYFMNNGLKRRDAALLFRVGNEQSAEIRESFMAANEVLGGAVAFELSLGVRGVLRASDVKAFVSSADVVVFACEPDITVAKAVQTLRGAGYSGAIIGVGYDDLMRNEAGAALDNSWWIVPAAPDDPQLLSFRTSYRDRYNEQVSRNDFAGTVLAFDSVRWFADVLYRAPGFQGEALRHSLLSTRNLALTHATLSIDPRTHAPWNKAVALVYCSNGAGKFQKRFRLR